MKALRANLCWPPIALLAFGLCWPASAQDPSVAPGDSALLLRTNLPTLTQVAQIRRLSLSEAGRHYPVKLRAVVLEYSTLPTLFISDRTGGIYVRANTNQSLVSGQLVEIEGVSAAGRFAPLVIPSLLRAAGRGELPPPRDVSFQRLATGVEDSQWVRVAGIVRSIGVQTLKGKLVCRALTLATEDGGRLKVLVDDYQGEPAPPLIDEEVAVTGIAESIYNGKRQLIDVRLLAPSAQFVAVKPGVPRPALAPRPIASLRQFSPENPSGHRLKVQGTITLQRLGECIFVRDDTGSIRIETHQREPVVPGDRVEALGFPAIRDSMPVMEDGVFHRLGPGQPPQPVALTAKEAQRDDFDAELVRLDAQLMDQFSTPEQLILLLQEGGTLFRAQLPQSYAVAPRLRNGARLRLTGICLRQFDNDRSPRALQILVRSPDDVAVLRQPSWWTPQRMRWALGILALVSLGAGVWVWTLRRQVSAQTEAIREKIEREAVLQERMRIAREFHDSLEQEIAGVRMQLELTEATIAHAPQTAVANLQMARSMVCHSQAEVRRSVWELRSQVLENRTLPAALSAAVASLENGSPIRVNVSGPARPLPMRVESNLLRIAQEAVANALKHAKPCHVTVRLDYQAGGVRLSIADDGCGFCVDQAPDGQSGHFGLLGMRERADKIAGSLLITASPGKGTQVEVFVPYPQNHPETNEAA